MSANTSIKEGGQPRSFGPVKALLVPSNSGAGAALAKWVPESERQLGTKRVDKNGVYQATKDGVYGYSSVYVNVPTDKGVTGTDPTTGQQVAVTTDPTTGEIVETVVPVEIRVTTPPTFIGPYGDNAYIDFSGLTVAAYDANGNKMQDVPFGELVFPVTVTDYSAVSTYSTATSDLIDGPVSFGSPPLIFGGPTETRLIMAGSGLAFTIGDPAYGGFIASKQNIHYYIWEEWGADPTHRNERESGLTPFTYGGKTAYVGGNYGGAFSNRVCNFPPNGNISLTNAAEAGWTILYGDITYGGQYVPVLWQRPGDGVMLETGFYVEVVDVSPSNNDGN